MLTLLMLSSLAQRVQQLRRDSRLGGCRLGGGGLALGELVADGAHDGGVADRAIVEGQAVDDGHGVQQPLGAELVDELGVLGNNI